MFFTRRLAFCLIVVAVVCSLGYLWPFFFVLGYILLAVLVLAILYNFVWLYAHKGALEVVRINPERLSIGDENPVELKVRNTFGIPVHAIIYDEPPFTFQMRELKLEADIEAGSEASMVYYVRPSRRGFYFFHSVNAFVSVWPRLVLRRFKTDQQFKTAVYPSFFFLRNSQLLSVENRNRMWGSKVVRRLGQSKEFEKIREYVVGDDYRSINWKATARRHHLMVNENQEEQSQNIYSIIDKGRGMQHTFNRLSLLDHAINSSLQLSYVAISHFDNAGVVTFDKKVDTYIPASRSSLQMNRLMSSLYDEVSMFYQSDYFSLYEFCKRKIQKRSLFVIYTTFDSLTALRRQLPYLKRMALSHVVLVTFFVDKDVEELATEPVSDTLGYVTQMVAQKFNFEQKLIVNELRRYGVYSLLTHPEHLTANVINRYLEFKARHVI
ncbi:MAG: DUF58 domain-containing protein [Paludibacteraceae bacterium]|nr:DUF58 domain-containing protein [Paludibacteraceae bacterium]